MCPSSCYKIKYTILLLNISFYHSITQTYIITVAVSSLVLKLSQPNFNQNEVGVTRQLVCNPPPTTTHNKLLDHFQTT